MKIRYWNSNSRQYQPREWLHSKLIKSRSILHNNYSFRQIMELCSGMEKHEFLVTFNDSRILYDIPDNVQPILHINCNRDIVNNLEGYLEFCGENDYVPIISIFCQGHISLEEIIKANSLNWFFLSGNSYNAIKNIMGTLLRERQIIYMEHYRNSKDITTFPKEFRKRQLPKAVVQRVIIRDVLNLIGADNGN